jgi:hypothetical protein
MSIFHGYRPLDLETLEDSVAIPQNHTLGAKFAMTDAAFAQYYATASALSLSTVKTDLTVGENVTIRLVKNGTGSTIVRGMAVIENTSTAHNILLPSAATTDAEGVAGVVACDIAAGYYGWIVTSGPIYMITDGAGALAVGALVATSTLTAGNVEATAAKTGVTLGRVRKAVAATAGLYPVVSFKIP